MKRRIIIIALAFLLTVGCTRVEKAQQEPVNVSMFQRVESVGSWQIVADRETGVMYAVSDGVYSRGIFTVLVDAEGKPLIYEERKGKE